MVDYNGKIPQWIKDAFDNIKDKVFNFVNNHLVNETSGFFWDENGISHTLPDCWQQYMGYNDFYDYGAIFFTEIASAKQPLHGMANNI